MWKLLGKIRKNGRAVIFWDRDARMFPNAELLPVLRIPLRRPAAPCSCTSADCLFYVFSETHFNYPFPGKPYLHSWLGDILLQNFPERLAELDFYRDSLDWCITFGVSPTRRWASQGQRVWLSCLLLDPQTLATPVTGIFQVFNDYSLNERIFWEK